MKSGEQQRLLAISTSASDDSNHVEYKATDDDVSMFAAGHNATILLEQVLAAPFKLYRLFQAAADGHEHQKHAVWGTNSKGERCIIFKS
jgi:hypothetical protein